MHRDLAFAKVIARGSDRPGPATQRNPPAHSRQAPLVLKEPINVAYTKSVIEELKSVKLKPVPSGYNMGLITQDREVNVADLLQIFVNRARGTTHHGIGWITVVYSDMRCPEGLLGRRISGAKFLDSEVADLDHEIGIAIEWRGVSAFALPKVLRHVLRHALPLKDLDAQNAMFNLMKYYMLPQLQGVPTLTAVQLYTEHRAQILENMMEGFMIGKDTAKEMILKVSNGGKLDTLLAALPDTPTTGENTLHPTILKFMVSLDSEMEALRAIVYQQSTDDQKLYVTDRDRPHVSLFSFAWMALERKFIDGLMAALDRAGLQVTSIEHDGVNVWHVGTGAELLDVVDALVPIPMAIKAPVSDPLQELLVHCTATIVQDAVMAPLVLAVGISHELVACDPWGDVGDGMSKHELLQNSKLQLKVGGPRGQSWRIVRLTHTTASMDGKVVLTMLAEPVAQVPHLISLDRNGTIHVLYQSHNSDSSTPYKLPSAVSTALADAKVVHLTIGVTGVKKGPLVVQFAQVMAQSGTLLVGNMRLVEINKGVADSGEIPMWEDLREELLRHKPEAFAALIANASRAIYMKSETPFQRGLKIMYPQAKEFMEFRAKTGMNIRSIKDGPIFPKGMTIDTSKIIFKNWTKDKTIELLTLDEVFDGRRNVDGTPMDRIELCYKKSVWFVGGAGGGKTLMCQALARRECVRQAAEMFFDGKGNMDGFGTLTKEGYMSQFGAFVMGDFKFTFGQREVLDYECIKNILQTEVQCEHAARYYNGRWPAEVVRMFSVNAGTNPNTKEVDYGDWFDKQDLAGLAMLARGEEDNLRLPGHDQERAGARRVLIACMPDDFVEIDEAVVNADAIERAQIRRDRQAKFDAEGE